MNISIECPSDFGANLVQHSTKALRCRAFCFYRAVQFVKNPAVLFTFCEFYGIITLGSYLLYKLEFDEENHE